MKKSAIFKILTLFLTFVIFSCCSGCFVESCIGSCIDKQETKEKAKFLERAKAKKAEADAFIPEVNDYIFEVKQKSFFKSDEEAYKAGFFDYYTYCLRNYYFSRIGESQLISNITIYSKDHTLLCDFKCDLNNIVGGVFFSRYSIDMFFHKEVEFDGKIFIIPEFERSKSGYVLSPITPPALYMIDVENGRILYCGYFEGWYEELFNNYKAGDFYDYYYKITKKINEGENNKEN